METQKNGAEMETKFNPQAIENDIYQAWETSGAFTAHRVPGKKPFTIVMPPPNITGQLHMGCSGVRRAPEYRSGVSA